MQLYKYALVVILSCFLITSCKDTPKNAEINTINTSPVIDSTEIKQAHEEKENKNAFVLTEENAIDFFFNYSKTLTENKVKITTRFGSFVIQLFDNVPYHKANFIYLTKKGYFNETQFHRVVKNFIIQGGSSDDRKTSKKRKAIGKYLLPPDTKKGYKHHRGTVSMPSSEINNPHMLASPYEFFVVVTKPGSYHLDGEYTPFGKVIEGMDVVDLINEQPVEPGDWPVQNIYIQQAEVIE